MIFFSCDVGKPIFWVESCVVRDLVLKLLHEKKHRSKGGKYLMRFTAENKEILRDFDLLSFFETIFPRDIKVTFVVVASALLFMSLKSICLLWFFKLTIKWEGSTLLLLAPFLPLFCLFRHLKNDDCDENFHFCTVSDVESWFMYVAEETCVFKWENFRMKICWKFKSEKLKISYWKMFDEKLPHE